MRLDLGASKNPNPKPRPCSMPPRHAQGPQVLTVNSGKSTYPNFQQKGPNMDPKMLQLLRLGTPKKSAPRFWKNSPCGTLVFLILNPESVGLRDWDTAIKLITLSFRLSSDIKRTQTVQDMSNSCPEQWPNIRLQVQVVGTRGFKDRSGAPGPGWLGTIVPLK